MAAIRKWNDVGGLQLAVLQWLAPRPRTDEYIFDRLGRRGHGRLMPSLVERGLMVERDGLYHLSDHGKAVLLPPDQYQQWKKDWGMS